jgi:hypothetical protein
MYEEMAREIEGEPWASVHAWAEEPTRHDWDIKSGVNFMQFVDCLGVRSWSYILISVILISIRYITFVVEIGIGCIQGKSLHRNAAHRRGQNGAFPVGTPGPYGPAEVATQGREQTEKNQICDQGSRQWQPSQAARLCHSSEELMTCLLCRI